MKAALLTIKFWHKSTLKSKDSLVGVFLLLPSLLIAEEVVNDNDLKIGLIKGDGVYSVPNQQWGGELAYWWGEEGPEYFINTGFRHQRLNPLERETRELKLGGGFIFTGFERPWHRFDFGFGAGLAGYHDVEEGFLRGGLYLLSNINMHFNIYGPWQFHFGCLIEGGIAKHIPSEYSPLEEPSRGYFFAALIPQIGIRYDLF